LSLTFLWLLDNRKLLLLIKKKRMVLASELTTMVSTQMPSVVLNLQ
jgi:hypothetical protein